MGSTLSGVLVFHWCIAAAKRHVLAPLVHATYDILLYMYGRRVDQIGSSGGSANNRELKYLSWK